METKTRGKLQVACLGRVGVDFYSMEQHTDLKNCSVFRKSLGGSPGNIAVALARLGMRVGMVSKIASDSFGDFIREFLVAENVDVRCLSGDSSGTKNSLAITEVKPEGCEVLFYRNNPSDLNLSEEDIETEYFQNVSSLLISGLAMSSPKSEAAVRKAAEIVKKNGGKLIVDLDYREDSWESAELAGETLLPVAQNADILIGNKEEFLVFEKSLNKTDAGEIADTFIENGTELVLLKDGKAGCKAFTGLSTMFFPAYSVKALKPFGAGDAFAGGVIYGLFHDFKLSQAIKYGSAAAALVVTRIGCAEVMPRLHEIEEFIQSKEAESSS